MGSYDIETYRELFGTELGTILYGHSHQHFVKPSTLESSDLDKDRDGKGSILGVTPVGTSSAHFLNLGKGCLADK